MPHPKRPIDEKFRELAAWSLPDGKLLWSVHEKGNDLIGTVVVRPGGNEVAAHAMRDVLVFSSSGQFLRQSKTDFLSGELVYSPDGKFFVSPSGKTLKLYDADTGNVAIEIELTTHDYTSAEAAAFLPDGKHIVVGLRVINDKGQTSGKLQLVDWTKREVVKSTNIDHQPRTVSVEPRGTWACFGTELKSRSCLLFWDLQKLELVGEQRISRGVSGLAISPTGAQYAITSNDHVIRIFDYATRKTVQTIEHATEDTCGGSLAWSADGNYLAFAARGKPPAGGLVLYRQHNGAWELMASDEEKAAIATAAVAPRPPVRVYTRTSALDVLEHGQLTANQFPTKCEHCSFPDLDAVPQPYVLVRGHEAAGDFTGAAFGNLLVSARARQMFEAAVPGEVKFYPTVDAKTKEPTHWQLAVPQTVVSAYTVTSSSARCPKCGELKEVSKLTPLAEIATTADVFKSQEWRNNGVIKSDDRLAKKYYKAQGGKIPSHQWIRLFLAREYWFSMRLLFLARELKFKGISYNDFLGNQKPTPADIAWIAEKLQLMRAAPAAEQTPKKPANATQWFQDYLASKASKKPLATADGIAAWEKKNSIQLPQSYADFVTTAGRHSFGDVFGREGYSVRVVGPKSLDAREYRRDPPEEGEEAQPDGLLFAVAINGDAFCFDLRGAEQDYPVFHFDHETESFEPFADNFAAAIQRMTEKG